MIYYNLITEFSYSNINKLQNNQVKTDYLTFLSL